MANSRASHRTSGSGCWTFLDEAAAERARHYGGMPEVDLSNRPTAEQIWTARESQRLLGRSFAAEVDIVWTTEALPSNPVDNLDKRSTTGLDSARGIDHTGSAVDPQVGPIVNDSLRSTHANQATAAAATVHSTTSEPKQARRKQSRPKQARPKQWENVTKLTAAQTAIMLRAPFGLREGHLFRKLAIAELGGLDEAIRLWFSCRDLIISGGYTKLCELIPLHTLIVNCFNRYSSSVPYGRGKLRHVMGNTITNWHTSTNMIYAYTAWSEQQRVAYNHQTPFEQFKLDSWQIGFHWDILDTMVFDIIVIASTYCPHLIGRKYEFELELSELQHERLNRGTSGPFILLCTHTHIFLTRFAELKGCDGIRSRLEQLPPQRGRPGWSWQVEFDVRLESVEHWGSGKTMAVDGSLPASLFTNLSEIMRRGLSGATGAGRSPNRCLSTWYSLFEFYSDRPLRRGRPHERDANKTATSTSTVLKSTEQP